MGTRGNWEERCESQTSFVPSEVYFAFRVGLPHRDICSRNANYFSHSLGVCVRLWMTQNAAHKSSHLVLTNDQTNKEVARVAQVPIVEIQVTCEKSGTTQFKQEWNYRVVL